MSTQQHGPANASPSSAYPLNSQLAEADLSLPSPAPSDDCHVSHSATPAGSLSAKNQRGQKRPSAIAFPTAQNLQPSTPDQGSYDWHQLKNHYHANLRLFQRGMGQLRDSERLRLGTLNEAVDNDDHTFVICHQILCLYSHDPSKVVHLLRATSSSRQSMMTMDGFMNTNDSIRPEFYSFWSPFPVEITLAHSRDPSYRTHLPQIMASFDCFTRRYVMFKEQCQKRQRPPSTGELATILLISSPIHQRVVFHDLLQTSLPSFASAYLPFAMQFFKNEDQLLWSNCHKQRCFTEYDETVITKKWHYLLDLIWTRTQAQPQIPQQPQPLQSSQLPRPAQVSQSPQQLPTLNGRRASQYQTTPTISTIGASASGTPNPSAYVGVSVPLGPNALMMNRQAQATTQPPLITTNGHHRYLSSETAPNALLRQSLQPPQSSQHQQVQLQVPRPAQSQQQQQFGTHSRQTHNANNSAVAQNQTVKRTPFFAQEGKAGPQVVPPNPDSYALHQAHLRSPRLKIVQPVGEATWFQRVSGFALRPSKLDSHSSVQKFTFQLTPELVARLGKDDDGGELGDKTRHLNPDSATYRLRCVKGAVRCALSDWVLMETTWPNEIHFELNNNNLNPRVKLHFGRNMPIDLTSMLKEGINTVDVYSLPRFDDTPRQEYTIAVECVTLITTSQIIATAHTNTIPSNVTVNAIAQAIKPKPMGPHSMHDDVECLNTTVSINLIDPIMGIGIWKIPARTQTCKHREAFDLRAFIETRRGANATDQPSGADVWLCPICEADARPDQLIIDGFLIQLRRELEEKGLIETVRVVDVDEKGSWTMREERGAGTKTGANGTMRAAGSTNGGGNVPDWATEVREILDLGD